MELKRLNFTKKKKTKNYEILIRIPVFPNLFFYFKQNKENIVKIKSNNTERLTMKHSWLLPRSLLIPEVHSVPRAKEPAEAALPGVLFLSLTRRLLLLGLGFSIFGITY